MSSAEAAPENARTLAAKLRDTSAETRRRALEDLFALDWSSSRAHLLDALSAGAWPERRRILAHLHAQFGQAATAAVLRLLDGVPAGGPPDPPGGLAERELLTELEAGIALVMLRAGATSHAARHCERARKIAPRSLSAARARADHHQALVLLRQRDTGAALVLLRRALETFDRVDDDAGEAQVADTLGTVHFELLELGEADYFYRRSLALKLQDDDLHGQAITYGNLGRLAAFRGDTEEAFELFYRDLKIAEQIGDDHGACVANGCLADLYLREDSLEEATRHAQEAARLAERSPDPLDPAHCLVVASRLELEGGRHEDAIARARRASEAFRAASDQESACHAGLLEAEAERRRGNLEAARALATRVREELAEMGEAPAEARACIELALIEQKDGHVDVAEQRLREGLDLTRRLPRTALQADLYRYMAHVQVGRWLADNGVEPQPIEDAIEASYLRGRGLSQLVLERKLLDPAGLRRLITVDAGIPEVAASQVDVQLRTSAAELPRRLAERLHAVVLGREGSSWRVAMSDPLDLMARLQLEAALGGIVQPLLIETGLLANAIRLAYSRPRLGLDRHGDAVVAVSRLLAGAVTERASDVHLEPGREAFVARYRIDGVMHEVDRVAIGAARPMVSRLKVLAGMDITERRRGQDGRAQFAHDGTRWNLRLSTLPCLHGEKVVVRILAQARALSLSELGIDELTIARVKRLVARQEGMMLAVGPTGSGKSTTLQAALAEIDSVERTVFTVEDPVEFEVPTFAQSQVDAEGGHGYADALRTLLRQDPNVILLGEVRDSESATIAVRMALTGHLVLSSLHTYDAAAAVNRLVQMGVPAYLVAATVKGVLAQRLVRRLCPACNEPDPVDRDWLRGLDPDEALVERLVKADVRGPGGCAPCGQRGYAGRFPVFEYLDVEEHTAEAIRRGLDEVALRRLARQRGVRTIATNALHRLAAGDTSQAEVMRVL